MFVRGSFDFYPGVSAARYLEGCQLFMTGSTIYLLLALFAAHEVLEDARLNRTPVSPAAMVEQALYVLVRARPTCCACACACASLRLARACITTVNFVRRDPSSSSRVPHSSHRTCRSRPHPHRRCRSTSRSARRSRYCGARSTTSPEGLSRRRPTSRSS